MTPVARYLIETAAKLPCRTFHGQHGPYLSRYTLAETHDGGAVYLHYFYRGDEDRELHNHPWAGSSLILAGGYREERRVTRDACGSEIHWQVFRPGDVNVIDPDTFHRIDLLDKAGCWTLFTTGPKLQSWGFWHRDTGVFTPWRDAVRARGLEPMEPRR